MSDKQPSLENWDDFSGVYLKADEVKAFPLVIVPTHIEAEFSEGKTKVSIDFLHKDRERKMGINKTNLEMIKAKGLMPKEIVGKKLSFGKCKVRNPSTNLMVDSFILEAIE